MVLHDWYKSFDGKYGVLGYWFLLDMQILEINMVPLQNSTST